MKQSLFLTYILLCCTGSIVPSALQREQLPVPFALDFEPLLSSGAATPPPGSAIATPAVTTDNITPTEQQESLEGEPVPVLEPEPASEAEAKAVPLPAPSTSHEAEAPKASSSTPIVNTSLAPEEGSDATPQAATEAHFPLQLITPHPTERPLLQELPPPIDTMVYLGSYIEPWRYALDEKIEFIFDNAELTTIVEYIAEKFNITFLSDDAIKPFPAGGKSILGTKISFKAHLPLTPQEVWNLFTTFLDMTGIAVVPGPGERVYRLVASAKDSKQGQGPLPTFIGIDPSLIPSNDILIRYVYFIQNIDIKSVLTVVDSLRSPASPHAVSLPELQAVMITDRALNIKTLIAVLQELDQTNAQEGLAVIKLARADAVKAAKLYADFAKQETTQGMASRLLGARKTPTNEYFPRGARVIPEPRQNLLIVLGSRDAIEVVTEFVRTVIDRQDDRPETPRYIVPLKHLDAENLASILTEALKFKEESEASHMGGVRNGDKYIKSISIVPEPTTNTLIISAEYEDFAKLNTLIKSLDIEQPQVALRLFIVSITNVNNTGFGVQMRNKVPGPNGLLGNNVSYQTTGLANVSPDGLVERVTTPNGAERLLGNILNIASGAQIGSTIVALGSDVFGVWGLLNMLQTYTKSEVVANPFLVTTNKFPAQFKLGEIRRVSDATIFTTVSATAFTDIPATLSISITPQISSDGLVSLDIYFDLEQFTDLNVNSANGNRTERKIETSVIVADNEVLALGGLIRSTVTESESKVPILGSIPFFGWLFKNRTRSVTDTSLLLLLQAEIIHPVAKNQSTRLLTEQQAHDSKALAEEIRLSRGIQDPINRLFFNDRNKVEDRFINRFLAKENVYTMQAVTAREQDSSAPQEREAQKSVHTTAHNDVTDPKARARRRNKGLSKGKKEQPTDKDRPADLLSFIDDKESQ